MDYTPINPDFGTATDPFGVISDPFSPVATDAQGEPAALRRRMARTRRFEALHHATAREAIGTLPDEGEAVHCLTAKGWQLHQLLPVLLDLAGVGIETLSIATLSFSSGFGRMLTGLMDAGKIRNLTLLASVFFESHNSDLYRTVRHSLTERGARVGLDLNHAKTLVAVFTDGRAVVVESSANMRSCSSREFVTIIGDRTLADWHAAWIERAVAEANQ